MEPSSRMKATIEGVALLHPRLVVTHEVFIASSPRKVQSLRRLCNKYAAISDYKNKKEDGYEIRDFEILHGPFSHHIHMYRKNVPFMLFLMLLGVFENSHASVITHFDLDMMTGLMEKEKKNE